MTPILVSKFGIYKVNFIGMIVATLASIPTVFFGYTGNLTMFIAFSLRRGLGSSPMLGTLNAVIAETATYSYNKEGVRLDGPMLRCSLRSVVALTGWLLALDGFDDEAAVQTAGAISMFNFIYLILPLVLTVAMTFIVAKLDVEKANKQLTAAQS